MTPDNMATAAVDVWLSRGHRGRARPRARGVCMASRVGGVAGTEVTLEGPVD